MSLEQKEDFYFANIISKIIKGDKEFFTETDSYKIVKYFLIKTQSLENQIKELEDRVYILEKNTKNHNEIIIALKDFLEKMAKKIGWI